MEKLYVACELGPRSSRILLGTLQHQMLKLGELHRFPTPLLKDKQGAQLNIPELFQQIVAGLAALGKQDVNLQGVSCTSWSGDYLLFDRDGALLSPVFYCDQQRSAAGQTAIYKKATAAVIYEETGNPPRPGSTLFQLGAESGKRLKHARALLPVADGFNHLLGGVAAAEASLASTTGIYSPVTRSWSRLLSEKLDLPQTLFAPVVSPGTRLGQLRADLATQTHLDGAQVIASCSHELAAALAGLPVDRGSDWGYLRIGEETLIGAVGATPIITAGTQALGYANETVYGGQNNFYRRTAGLFILDECRRYWIERDREVNDDVLLHLATGATAFEALIDVTDPRFAQPGNMPEKIQSYCRETGQEIPRKPGELVRCVLESLALHYRKVFYETEVLTGGRFGRVFLFGAEQNNLLNHFVVDALHVPAIVASPDSAAIGNVLVQALTLGHLTSSEEAQQVLRNSFKMQAIIPHHSNWQQASQKLQQIMATAPVPA
jgi:rhamnulokinase